MTHLDPDPLTYVEPDPDARFDGPDCGVNGCQREVGHIGDHHRWAEPSSPGTAVWIVAAGLVGLALVVGIAGYLASRS